MNIFLMLLAFLFMGTYYMLSGPSLHRETHTVEYAITQADLRGIAECTAAVHNASIRGGEFDDQCVSENGITSLFVCLNKSLDVTDCNASTGRRPVFSYIVTATSPIPMDQYNNMMEIMDKYYSDAGTFGIFSDGTIASGGTASRRIVPRGVITKMELTAGQLVYMTQYEIPDADIEFTDPESADISCPGGTIKTYRFGRWQCVTHNMKSDCGGDMIWNSTLYECVPDESRKPLCASKQTAVIVDDVWECIDPFPEQSCATNMISRLNYETLEWECVPDPAATVDTKKCAAATRGVVYGGIGATLRVSAASSCTDCERMIIDSETCASACVPDPAKINLPACYPGTISECSGPSRAFYFGFTNASAATGVDALKNAYIPIDKSHSQNRRCNSMDCGAGEIDSARSVPPYTAICK